MYQPGVGTTELELEAVAAIQLPQSAPLEFFHHKLQEQGRWGSRRDEITLPREMAARLVHFATKHFVEGAGDFDCRSFVEYVAGWKESTHRGRRPQCKGVPIHPDHVEEGEPYFLFQSADQPIPHAVLGHRRPSESFGVAGGECPIVIAKNRPLMAAFGATALLEAILDEPRESQLRGHKEAVRPRGAALALR